MKRERRKVGEVLIKKENILTKKKPRDRVKRNVRARDKTHKSNNSKSRITGLPSKTGHHNRENRTLTRESHTRENRITEKTVVRIRVAADKAEEKLNHRILKLR
jgi:hypothetical protein